MLCPFRHDQQRQIALRLRDGAAPWPYGVLGGGLSGARGIGLLADGAVESGADLAEVERDHRTVVFAIAARALSEIALSAVENCDQSSRACPLTSIPKRSVACPATPLQQQSGIASGNLCTLIGLSDKLGFNFGGTSYDFRCWRMVNGVALGRGFCGG